MKLEYIQIPIKLFRGFFDSPKATLLNIFYWGVFRLSRKSTIKDLDIARQIVYIVYREDGYSRLRHKISMLNLVSISEPTDYHFSPGMYVNDCFAEQIEELLTQFANDHNFREYCSDIVRIRAALKSLEVKFDVESLISQIHQIEVNRQESVPTVGVRMNLILDYLNKPKQQYQLIEFAAFHAIKSILGTKRMIKTNMLLVIARMFGYSKYTDLDISIFTHPIFLKYHNNKYQRNKLFEKLELCWHVKVISKNIRGFMIAIGDNVSYDEMANAMYGKSQKLRIARLKKQKKIALINSSENKLVQINIVT